MPILLPSVKAVRRSDLGPDWQQDTETRAAPGPIRHLDSSAVLSHDVLADCQSEPVAGHLRFKVRPAPIKGLENVLAAFDGDAWPLVFDPQLQLGVFGHMCRNL